MEYLERGATIEQFTEDYPSVTLDKAAKALEEASQMIEEYVYARPS